MKKVLIISIVILQITRIDASELFQEHFLHKKYRLAIIEAKKKLEQDPSSKNATIVLVKSYHLVKKWNLYFSSLLSYFKNYPPILEDKKELLSAISLAYKMKKYDVLLNLTRIYNHSLPTNDKIFNFMALSLYYLKDYQGSISAFYIALSYKKNPIYYTSLGRSYKKMHDIKNAIFYTKKALSFNPSYRKAIVQLAILQGKPIPTKNQAAENNKINSQNLQTTVEKTADTINNPQEQKKMINKTKIEIKDVQNGQPLTENTKSNSNITN